MSPKRDKRKSLNRISFMKTSYCESAFTVIKSKCHAIFFTLEITNITSISHIKIKFSKKVSQITTYIDVQQIVQSMH